MKINLTDLTEKIEQEDYLQDLETVKYADISKSKGKIKIIASKMIKETVAAIKHDSLSHIAVEVTGQRPVTFALEINIINLPYSNYKKIANFFEEDKSYPVFVYFETKSEFLNASGFRIDQLATEKEMQETEPELIERLTDLMVEKIKQVREYEKTTTVVKKTVKTSKSKAENKAKKID
ncbi:hypothetical protein [Lactobacillus bombicola]|uniref:Uncharacterized protein n=1 Tax=Lactobacillus bombicola TaxID=1505723 RepID=A0A396SR16_9LACO|nr:hypothetical protein [Lactobacillus bombicola]RHW51624.1 hypothetical protein DS833_02210 [Lactobacillus bombicola]RHW54949.1 hypothetical protein DS835_02220 [Lactobacillus bombicola]